MYIFIFAVFKILVSFILLGLILLLSILWVKIEKILNDTLFKTLPKKVKNIIIILFVILIELTIIFIVSLNWSVPFIDALFIGSLVLLCYIWLVPYFVNYQENIAKVTDKYFNAGVEIGEIKTFQMKISTFSLGSILFAVTINTFYRCSIARLLISTELQGYTKLLYLEDLIKKIRFINKNASFQIQ
ncbi:hypothetical protein PDN64_24510 [Bacillus cereus group sp. Bc256]|uniref:hypothetical protein n=1 Tax=Bacillus cereus group sp. Bc256 TaxID=3018102 RepID=UPI0022E23545|nr:hypothetical protein [Bacillus cereus group sp. Bc256]MDA2141248.1 hypothetical protein [Bacillus cereus group sp. Bc256]